MKSSLIHCHNQYINISTSHSLLRSIAVGISDGISCIAFALTQKSFPTLVEHLNFHGTFYVYAAIAFILTVWAVVTIKLTDGLSLVETERLYDSRTARNYDSVGTPKNDSSK